MNNEKESAWRIFGVHGMVPPFIRLKDALGRFLEMIIDMSEGISIVALA